MVTMVSRAGSTCRQQACRCSSRILSGLILLEERVSAQAYRTDKPDCWMVGTLDQVSRLRPQAFANQGSFGKWHCTLSRLQLETKT